MAVIPGGIADLIHSMFSYMFLVLTIAFFAKIISLIMSFGGGGGLFGGRDQGSGDQGSTGGDGDSNTTTVRDPEVDRDREQTPQEKLEAKEAAQVAKDKFDPYNPGYLKVLVSDEDDNPIQGAYVVITPAFAKKRKYFFFRNKDTWRIYGNQPTNADGYWPSRHEYAKVGSGTLTVHVRKKGWFRFRRFWKGRGGADVAQVESGWRSSKMKATPDMVELSMGEEKLVVVTLKKKGEKSEHFEPHIENIVVNNEHNTLSLTGRID